METDSSNGLVFLSFLSFLLLCVSYSLAALALVFVGQGSFMHTRESFNKKQKSKGH